jgi:hypothetical protein
MESIACADFCAKPLILKGRDFVFFISVHEKRTVPQNGFVPPWWPIPPSVGGVGLLGRTTNACLCELSD